MLVKLMGEKMVILFHNYLIRSKESYFCWICYQSFTHSDGFIEHDIVYFSALGFAHLIVQNNFLLLLILILQCTSFIIPK